MTGASSAAMQANAPGAVPKEGAGTTRRDSWRALRLEPVPGTVQYSAFCFWCPSGVLLASWPHAKAQLGGCVGRPPGKQEQNSHAAACRFRFRCRLLASQLRTTLG